jgi:RNA polymerase sigma factor (sigma-70 family)
METSTDAAGQRGAPASTRAVGATDPQRPSVARPSSPGAASIATLLRQWQAFGADATLEALIAAVRPLIERIAAQVFIRQHIRDPDAVDEAVARVFDHLRRLPRAADGERRVARFAPSEQAAGAGGDSGIAYMLWLARDRARDVARAYHRHGRWISPLTDRDAAALAVAGSCEPEEPSTSLSLEEAIQSLEPELRTVIALLLEGKSQVVIAHVLGVCEGTVSRMRCRASEKLRRLMRR